MGHDFWEIGWFTPGRAVEVLMREGRARQGVVRGANGAGLFLVRVREYTPNGWSDPLAAVEEFLPWLNVARVELLNHEPFFGDTLDAFVAAGYVTIGAISDAEDRDCRR